MPARRYGSSGAWFVRHGMFPPPYSGSVLRLLPARGNEELDDLKRAITDAWARFAERAPRLPPSPPELGVLALRRSAALTVFLFGDDPAPLLVCKLPRRGSPGVEHEATALQEAEEARIAPLYLGEVGGARVQEALPGEPLRLDPLLPSDVASLEWDPRLETLGESLLRLARTTAKEASPKRDLDPTQRLLEGASLGRRCRVAVEDALSKLAGSARSILTHRDTSPQNCLFVGRELQGLVDWELAESEGLPGHDVWNAALAYTEQSIGLLKWSEGRALEAFEKSWSHSAFYGRAREIGAEVVVAAGYDPEDAHRMEIRFFARRLARRMTKPGNYATGVETAAKMLTLVCEE